MAQNRDFNSAWFLCDDVVSAMLILNAATFCIMSLAMKMNSQHDPNARFKNCVAAAATSVAPENSISHATKNPEGDFQSNADLF